MDEDDNMDTLEETVAIQKPKRQLTDKQKEATTANLAKGRAVRDAKRQVRKEEDDIKKEQEKAKKEQNQARIEQIVAKKAVKLASEQAKKENKLKQLIGEGLSEDDNDVEIEERIFKKPKKKKIIYREESDSEEEVIVRRKKPEVQLPPPPPQPVVSMPLQKRAPTIMFY